MLWGTGLRYLDSEKAMQPGSLPSMAVQGYVGGRLWLLDCLLSARHKLYLSNASILASATRTGNEGIPAVPTTVDIDRWGYIDSFRGPLIPRSWRSSSSRWVRLPATVESISGWYNLFRSVHLRPLKYQIDVRLQAPCRKSIIASSRRTS
ncbi:hypothetical protein DAEQUDRAFT_721055 [Daedalea quercina L-15889]|uniref:Uncharacterized protein n=1 Tax=Daedalea quercina L-15889 TaxID=1314783 RepID=A0A165TZ83_9APHY|nr:hypothetical protein DAEQUDRAFT_721055 [Daedalea quercina L-15889]